MQHRRCIHGMRPGLGRHSLCNNGSVQDALEGDFKGGLPLIFNFMNNQYGMGGQTAGETMGYDILARVGAGVNPEMMHAERIDGYNPLAVIDAFRRKRK